MENLLPPLTDLFICIHSTADYYGTDSGTSLYGLSRCFSVWILKVFSLSMAVQPLSCCL